MSNIYLPIKFYLALVKLQKLYCISFMRKNPPFLWRNWLDSAVNQKVDERVLSKNDLQYFSSKFQW